MVLRCLHLRAAGLAGLLDITGLQRWTARVYAVRKHHGDGTRRDGLGVRLGHGKQKHTRRTYTLTRTHTHGR